MYTVENNTIKIPITINGFETKFTIGDFVRLRHDPENLTYTIEKVMVFSDSGYSFEINRGLERTAVMPAECIGVD